MGNQIIGKEEIFNVIRSAVNHCVDLIKPTYGPAGNKVIISKVSHKLVVDDGVQIARDLELPDERENAVLHVIRETAIRTNDRAGDGTTGSLIMLQAIIEEISRLSKRDGRAIEKELKAGLEKAKEQLKAMAKPITAKADLERVARVSFDDAKIAALIAEAWFQLGKDGVLTVDRSGTMNSFSEMTDGVKIPNGYVSPHMVNNPQRMEAVVEKPHILLTDYRLTEASDVIPVMQKMVEKKIMNLVIVCEHIEGHALATLLVNRNIGFNAVVVSAPSSGDRRTVFLEDLAAMTGAKVFSQHTGDKLEDARIEDLGRADRFVAKSDSSVIIGPKAPKGEVEKAREALKKAIDATDKESEKRDLRQRVAMFAGKIGVIKVGAATENEERALRYKVEDAINATHSAFKSGVVPGAGIALQSLTTGSELLDLALKKPNEQIFENSGVRTNNPLRKGEALNVVTGKVGPFMEVGVMDPVEVLIAGVESAVSIAAMLATCTGMVLEPPKKPRQEQE